MKKEKLMLGDNIESLKKLPENSIDSVVTDGPYGLSFMNKKWDYDVPSVDFWKEVYRVLKPGGHLLSFGGTRTYHRMVVNIEDAGFEIRDQIQWLYGSGFPKSLNVGKAVDKLEGNEREYVKESENNRTGRTSDWSKEYNIRPYPPVTKGQSDWEGWGSALKPANEPICLARKPLSEKSIAENVLKWRTGGINVDGSRIKIDGDDDRQAGKRTCNIFDEVKVSGGIDSPEYVPSPEGRFPANLILDESAAEMLDEQSGVSKRGLDKVGKEYTSINNGKKLGMKNVMVSNYPGVGGASRFFYVAKVSKAERNMGLDGFDIEILTPTIKLLLKTDYNNKNLLWEKEDLQTKPVDMDRLHQKDIEEYGALLKKDKEWNTEWFGNILTDQFLMEVKSIIETETNSIMIYQILNLLIQKNIKKNIQESLGEMVSDINFVENVEKKNTKLSIILANKDGLNQNVNPVLLEEQWTINIKENKCSHPTLKPVNLMSYLCKLITPPNGIVLDPFMGSGSTGIAALLNDFRFVGMELDNDYFKIAEARINSYEEYRKFLRK